MKVIVSPRARGNIRRIERYLAAERGEAFASDVRNRLLQVLETLSDFPSLAPRWRDSRTRAIVATGLPYRIHYLVDEERSEVRVITIAHVRQRPPV